MVNAAVCNAMVPENIIRLIDERGLKQRAVAAKAGYRPQQFNDMLNGRRIIKVIDMLAIANALGVTPNILYGLEADSQRPTA